MTPLLLIAACAGPSARGAAPADSTAAATAPAPAQVDTIAPAPAAASEPLRFASSMARFEIGIPEAWGRQFSVSERAEPAEYPRATHVVEFLYLPVETSTPPTILGIVAYDASGWSAVKGGPDRPKGDVLLEQGGRVFVATRQANPFPRGGVDATRFDSMQAGIAGIRGTFKAR